ncbi:alpha/beta fold hydrolase [Rhizobium lusitanum]|uniref:Alpha/beta fold hydrolase n=1 Tax=Rhizobium lusitanum TaxID=293958 RepID=A0A6L9UA26_9HYPH|nr:alpha/beta fold hydrolase [Rhizobium lusitanum]
MSTHAGAVVLLHAAGLDRRMWNGIAASLLARGHVVHTLDLPGHGGKRTIAVNDMEAIAAHVADEIIGLPRPLNLVGLSLGGMVAQLVAGTMQAHIGKLVLCDTMCGPREELSNALRARAERTRSVGAVGMIEETVARWFGPATLDTGAPIVGIVRGWLAEADTEANARSWEAIAGFDARPALAKLRDVPSLVVCGALDTATPPAFSNEIADLLPGSRMVLLEGLGHMAPLEDENGFVKLVAEFLEAE